MPKILCLENPLLDIQAFGTLELLDKYGLKANDAILAAEFHKGLFDDLIDNWSAETTAGGGAQNTARGSQYMLPPDSVVYIGCVGNDSYAETLRESCQKAGVRTEYLVDGTHSTGRCGVIITDKNRSLCTELGAANHYKLEHLQRPDIWKIVQSAQIYFVGGYHLTVCPEAALALAKEAAAKNKIFVMSLSAPFIPAAFKDALDKTEPFWDYIVGNESEALAWAQSHGVKSESIPAIAEHIANLPKANVQRPRVVLITQGSSPTVIAVSGAPGYKEIPVRKISAEEIIDTTGAGDAFAGGLLAGIIGQESLETSVDMGHWLAHQGIKQTGPNYPLPNQSYTTA
ncbi:Adenosine kinase [Penicillium manginii]|uniref:Adenosine kinase n=1 Tax=Penicillium manginii TaxID=203109 RepID=UPI002548F402|nr:Adenosine kinase [Penicillium manginii]KAJ5739135.1 Adenosine kinase [Penicillium manginii]